MSLTGKRAVVVGGSRGIGAAIVRRLSGEGARVIFTYNASGERAEALVSSLRESQFIPCAIHADSADSEDLSEAIHAAARQMEGLDILVNNAGILIRGSITDFEIADFNRSVDVNVRGFFVAVKAAVQYMKGGGRIVAIGSTAADRIGFGGASVYCMTKAALATLVKGVSLDLSPRNITVNTVQPGPTASDMTPADGQRVGFLENLIPLKRLGQDHEIAAAVAFLCQAESSFITGATITVDGGYAV
jgi:3-oxoacyl-[acyl-carrier protein] reductase